jgi:hypothetical protein
MRTSGKPLPLLRKYLLNVGQQVDSTPAHADQDYVERTMQAFEHSGHRRIQRLHRAFSRSYPHIMADRLTATEPISCAYDLETAHETLRQ